MTSNPAWMPLHIGHYLQDTGHLSALEHGAYMLLIMHYWKDGGLPADEGMIRRIAKLSPAEWTDSRGVIVALFLDGWRHKRIDEELAKAEAIIAKRRAAGSQKGSKSTASAEQVPDKSTDTRVPTFDQVPPSNAIALDAAKPRDARDALWTEGVALLAEISGKPTNAAKALVGKWLKGTRDDCSLVLSKIQTAKADRVGEPVPWITAALQSQAPPKKVTHASMFRDEGRELGLLPNEPTREINGRVETSLPRGSDQGANPARHLARSGSG